MVSGAMCRRFESFQARSTFPRKGGGLWDLFFESDSHYSYPYSNRKGSCAEKEGKRGGFGLPPQGPIVGGQYKIQTRNGAKKTKYIYSKIRKGAASKLADAVAERDSGLVYDCGSVSLGDYLGGGWRP